MSVEGGSAGYCAVARASIDRGRHDEAIVLLRQAVARDPTSADAYELLGIAQMGKGVLADAIGSLSTAAGLCPDRAGPHYGLALVYQRAGNVEAAVRELTETLRIEPGNVSAQHFLASLQQPAAPRAGLDAPPDGATTGPSADAWEPVGPDRGGWSPANMARLLVSPRAFIREQRGREGLVTPCILLAVQAVALVMAATVASVLIGTAQGMVLHYGVSYEVAAALGRAAMVAAGSVALAFALAGLIHVGVIAARGRGGFGATLRAVAYGLATFAYPAWVLGALNAISPIQEAVGGRWALAATAWVFAVIAVGLTYLHELSAWKAIAAALIPACLFCSIGTLVAAVLQAGPAMGR